VQVRLVARRADDRVRAGATAAAGHHARTQAAARPGALTQNPPRMSDLPGRPTDGGSPS
jgi:hypothetical protein